MEKKYYWIWAEVEKTTKPAKAIYQPYVTIIEHQELIDEHPLRYIVDCNKVYGDYSDFGDQLSEVWKLRNWKEIGKEEFELYKSYFE